MTHTIDAATLRRHLSPQVSTGNGSAYLTSGSLPDPLLTELFPDVAAALATFVATIDDAREIHAKYRDAIDARADHKESPEAVYTSNPENGLVFTDAEGVRIQNEIKAIEKALAANGARSKQALLDYLVTAILRQPEAKDEATRRAIEADEAANAAAEALTKALEARERFWNLAGQPYPGVAEPQVRNAGASRAMLQHQRQNDLKHAIERVLPFPLKAGK